MACDSLAFLPRFLIGHCRFVFRCLLPLTNVEQVQTEQVHSRTHHSHPVEQSAQRSLGRLPQVEVRRSAVDDVLLPVNSVDLAVMVDVYHELAYPYEVMTSLMKALKPGGQVVFVEYKAEDIRVPIKPLHKMSEVQIRREAAVFDLEWERTVSSLPWQHVVVFRKRN